MADDDHRHIQSMDLVRDGQLAEGYRTPHTHTAESMAMLTERAQHTTTQMAPHAGRL
ncbi:hypothetical protein [Streptomyces melanogenes]|uniref:hypothetical protein n=1 Tax=Streptomyces melanogenes TaxID=67326 RepID=UPI0037B980DC